LGETEELRALKPKVKAVEMPRVVAEADQYRFSLELNRNGRWPTDSFLATPPPSQGIEQAGRSFIAGQPGVPASAAPPQTSIFLPSKLPESESQLALTAKAPEGSFSGGGIGGGGGVAAAPPNLPKSAPAQAEPNQNVSSYGIASEDRSKMRYALAGEAAPARAGASLSQEAKPRFGGRASDRAPDDVKDRPPAVGIEIYRGVSVMTNGRIEMQPVPPETAQWQALGQNNPLSARATEKPLLSPAGPRSSGDGDTADVGGLRQSAWSDKEHQKNGGVLKVETSGQFPDNHVLSFDLADSGRAGSTAGKPTLGDAPAPGTLFKEAPPQQKEEMGVEQGVNEAVRRQALTPAREPGKEAEKVTGVRATNLQQLLKPYGELTGRTVLQPATLPNSPVTLEIDSPLYRTGALEALKAALWANGVAVEDFGDRYVKVVPAPNAGQVGVATPTLTSPAAIDPTTGLPVAEAAPSVDPTTGLPLPQLRSDRGPSNFYELNVAGYANVPMPVGSNYAIVSTNLSPAEIRGFYDDGKATPAELADAGKRLLMEGNRDEAEAKLKEAVKKDPQNQTAYYYLNQIAEAKFHDALNKRDEASRNRLGEIEKAWATPPGSNAAENARLYADAKTKLEELQRFDQVLRMKAAGEKTDLQLPKNSMVEIVDPAQPVESPSLGQKLRGLVSSTVERKARIKVGERDQSDITGPHEKQTAAGYDPYFVQIEAEVIQSDEVLGRVVDNLKLQEAWAKKRGTSTPLPKSEVVKMLKEQLDVKSVGKTDLLDIGVKSEKPEEAAKLANAVAQSYRAYRLEQRKELSVQEVAALEERLAENEQKVRAAQSNVDVLREKLQVPDSAAASAAKIDKSDDARPPKPATPPAEPQPEIQTRDNAFSTFSLNVSDVSFKLAAASLEKGLLPEPASIRSEEFINAFDYRDPEPAPGAPIAFAWERARYPFAQNRDLLRFSLKTAALGRQAGRPLNLVLLLDNSGSMERADRVSIIREALRVLATQLQPNDTLSVVLFARTPRLWVDGAPGNQAGKVADELSGLTPEGGTNLGDALDLAYQTALRHYLMAGINRVVLLTDGAANLGNVEPEELKKKVEANRKQGVALDCFGIGWEGYNDDLLEVLTRNGDGRYGFINTPEEAATEFAGQLAGALHVAASDVKVQVEFNTNRVTAYRQIGYAKHQLTKEQFRDNSVDAAELGAAESGNALYVVDVNGGGDGPLATVRVRYKVPGTMQYQEHEWTVPYTGTATPLEQASPALRLAASASAFSEWLATSPYAAEVTLDSVLGYLRGVPEVYGADAKPKKLEWMVRQAKSLAGK
jgi:Mg-chelatase subunit ChlD/capsular polysaccharide biosynthesis protein